MIYQSGLCIYYMKLWPIYIFNLVDTTKLPCYPHRRSTTVSLETFTLYYMKQTETELN